MTPTIFSTLAVIGILGVALSLFLRNRIRYDVVALLIMLAVIATGVMTAEEVFSNLGHPAIIIVASMFVMSEAFVRSGLVDGILGRLPFLYTRPVLALSFLILFVVILSAFVNNAGALAMTIPLAIYLARKSNTPISFFLLPLAFASHLGGFMTLIGTPRNILISDFRNEAVGTPFAMFDFFYVGGSVALLGAAFLILFAWRILPRKAGRSDKPIVRPYTTEVRLSDTSDAVGLTCQQFEEVCKHEVKIISLHTTEGTSPVSPDTILTSDMTLNLRGTVDALIQYTRRYKLSLIGLRAHEQFVTNEDDHTTLEVVIPPYAKLIGSNWNLVPLPKRFGVNLVGIFRRDHTITSPVAETTLWPNDILVFQGRTDSLAEAVRDLELLPIAEPETNLGQKSSAVLTPLLLIMAIAIATANILPLEVIFLTTALLVILLNLISLRQAYESIDQTVLILLSGMITLGEALERSGAAEAITNLLMNLDGVFGPIVMLIVILISAMLMSDFMNTTASAVVMAPIAILTAESLGVSIDPFLMVVAIGASCAFLTPIGHESNAMVMRQGGYTFGDYFKVGFPLELIIVSATIPLILIFWPF